MSLSDQGDRLLASSSATETSISSITLLSSRLKTFKHTIRTYVGTRAD